MGNGNRGDVVPPGENSEQIAWGGFETPFTCATQKLVRQISVGMS